MKLVQQCFLTMLFLFGAILPLWFTHDLNYILRALGAWTYEESLQAVVERPLEGEAGYYSVAIRHLVSGEKANYNAGTQLAAASLYKLAVLYAAYKERETGNLSFDDVLVMTPEAAALVDDEEPSIPVGGATTVGEAIIQMITVSDNASAILLLQGIGPAIVNSTMLELGLTQTEVGIGELSLTSADDILALLEKIYRGDGQSKEARQEMIGILLQQAINDRLPRYLPPETPVAHKTGDLGDVRNDAGIVFAPNGPYVIVVMAQDLPDVDRGAEVIARLSKNVYKYFTRHGT